MAQTRWQPYHRTLLADAFRRRLESETGDAASLLDGLRAVKDGLNIAGKTGESCWNSELYHLKGELLTASPDPHDHSKAQAALRRALRISRQQQAKLFELRAALALARLWQRQRKPQPARQLLEPLYRSFTEGLDTPTLQDARQCLDNPG